MTRPRFDPIAEITLRNRQLAYSAVVCNGAQQRDMNALNRLKLAWCKAPAEVTMNVSGGNSREIF